MHDKPNNSDDRYQDSQNPDDQDNLEPEAANDTTEVERRVIGVVIPLHQIMRRAFQKAVVRRRSQRN